MKYKIECSNPKCNHQTELEFCAKNKIREADMVQEAKETYLCQVCKEDKELGLEKQWLSQITSIEGQSIREEDTEDLVGMEIEKPETNYTTPRRKKKRINNRRKKKTDFKVLDIPPVKDFFEDDDNRSSEEF